jgi:hypothetical protein
MARETAAHIGSSHAVALLGTVKAPGSTTLLPSCSCTVVGWSMLVLWRAFLGVGAVPLIVVLGCRVFV